MESNENTKSRKVLLINPRFQFRFMAWMGGLAVAVILVMQAAHSWFFYQLREQARLSQLPADHVFYHFIDSKQLEMNTITAISFLAVLVVVGVIGLTLSHKIAGPLHRMKVHFDETAITGAPQKIKFRDSDYFTEVPEAYNRQFHIPNEKS